MLLRIALTVVSIASIGSAMVLAGDDYVDRARQDLAKRLKVPLERVVVGAQDARDIQDLTSACVRVDAPMDQLISKEAGLVLVVKGQKHYYYAEPGESYRYCELPSTKKRGPIGPPIE